MASKSLTLVIQPRGKPIKGLPEETTVTNTGSTAKLYEAIAKASRCSVHRLRITKGSDGSVVPNSTDVTVNDTGLRDRSKINVKDLGPQAAWRTVFIVEYFGPIALHVLFFALRPLIYNTDEPASQLQTISFWMIVAHFVKRELETIFVHRFSLATMPVLNIFKNSAHYWALSGVNIAYWTYRPDAPTAKEPNPLFLYAGIAAFVVGELANISTHLTLRDLRRPGSTERGIPQGFGFNIVTCPNYMFESLAWVGVYLVNRSLSTVLFIMLAVGQMAIWAKKKERRYRREFGDKYKRKRYSIIPGVY